jgi:hypothetical protein
VADDRGRAVDLLGELGEPREHGAHVLVLVRVEFDRDPCHDRVDDEQLRLDAADEILDLEHVTREGDLLDVVPVLGDDDVNALRIAAGGLDAWPEDFGCGVLVREDHRVRWPVAVQLAPGEASGDTGEPHGLSEPTHTRDKG